MKSKHNSIKVLGGFQSFSGYFGIKTRHHPLKLICKGRISSNMMKGGL